MRRASSLLLISANALLIGGQGASGAPAASIAAGTYHGKLRCTGSDRLSSGAPTRHYRSSPAASVTLASGQRLTRWTYLFLGRKNLSIQARAVRPGQSFTYAAGKHIGRPGRTRVTIAQVITAPGSVQLVARMDWSSPPTHYIGAGTYALRLERINSSTIRYEAIKVVIKHPLGAPSRANPVVRRNECCTGQLTR